MIALESFGQAFWNFNRDRFNADVKETSRRDVLFEHNDEYSMVENECILLAGQLDYKWPRETNNFISASRSNLS